MKWIEGKLIPFGKSKNVNVHHWVAEKLVQSEYIMFTGLHSRETLISPLLTCRFYQLILIMEPQETK